MSRLHYFLIYITTILACACRSSAGTQVLDTQLKDLVALTPRSTELVDVIITTGTDNQPVIDVLQRQHIEFTAITSTTLTARIPVNRLKKIGRLPDIRLISKPQQMQPLQP